jgi:hypothetical protein
VIIHPGVGGKSVRGIGSDRQKGFFAGILPILATVDQGLGIDGTFHIHGTLTITPWHGVAGARMGRWREN